MAKPALKIFIGMSRALNAINRECEAVYRKYNLTHGQFAVLEALYHKGPLTIGQVSEKTLTTSGNIPIIVKNLEANGLLTKSVNPDDGRSFILTLTSRGTDLISQVYPENETIIRRYMQAWTGSERQELVALLQKFRRAHDL